MAIGRMYSAVAAALFGGLGQAVGTLNGELPPHLRKAPVWGNRFKPVGLEKTMHRKRKDPVTVTVCTHVDRSRCYKDDYGKPLNALGHVRR